VWRIGFLFGGGGGGGSGLRTTTKLDPSTGGGSVSVVLAEPGETEIS
jgi:hypothetical protein